MLDVKLKYLDQWHQARRHNAALYDQLLAGSPIKTPHIDEGNFSIYNQYCVRVANRDAVRQRLADKGIGSEVYYPLPLHRQECFAHLKPRPGGFPHSEKACLEVLALPVYPELPEEHLRFVCDELKSATKRN